MASSNENAPSEGKAARQVYVPRSEFSEVVGAERWKKKGIALVCSECDATKSSQWLANKNVADKPVCVVCYRRKLAASRGNCFECGKDGGNTSATHRSKLKKNSWLCQPCIKHEALNIETAARTKCVKWGTDTTSAWLNCKDKPGAKVWQSCYDKNHRIKKKAANATEE